MSADNTILILQTVAGDGRPEYRVAHVQNAEMAHLDMDPEARDEYIRCYFDKCTVFRKQDKAFKEAVRLHDLEMFVEYGIGTVNLGQKYPGLAGVGSTPVTKSAQAPHSKPVRKRKGRNSMVRRIGTLTRRVHELQWQLHLARTALEEVREEKAQVVARVEDAIAGHR